MRIWSVRPAQLDRAALVSCWRETLLAQAVLAGRTKGYRSHPQLDRWRSTPDPIAAIASYLHDVADEADARGYRFDRTRIDLARPAAAPDITVTDGQLAFEWSHLLAKAEARDAAWFERIRAEAPRAHPVLRVVPGDIEDWERGAPPT